MAMLPADSMFVCRRCLGRIFQRPSSAGRLPSSRQLRYLGSATTTQHNASRLPAKARIRPRYSDLTNSTFQTTVVDGIASNPSRTPIRTLRTRAVRTRIRNQLSSPRPTKTDNVYTPSVITERTKWTDDVSIPSQSPKEGPLKTQTLPDELIPSKPSPPIWAPDRPTTHATLHRSTLDSHNLYWETLPPTISQKAQANHFFTSPKTTANFLRSVAYFRFFPPSDVPEIAFVGRSNVGKSSLLNAICNVNLKGIRGGELAKTSKTPGFTKTMNLYGVGPPPGVSMQMQKGKLFDKIVGRQGLTIVDMPGYGEGSFASWGQEIMKYLQGRRQLRMVFVLVDALHGVKDKDQSLLASLRLAGVQHQVILSKMDRLFIPQAREVKRYDGKKLDRLKPKGDPKELELKMMEIRNQIQPPVGAGALGEILTCSSEVLVDGKRLGIDAVRYAMLRAIGWEFKKGNEPGGKAKDRTREPLVRTVKTNVVDKTEAKEETGIDEESEGTTFSIKRKGGTARSKVRR
ncbi:hypothetical protein BS50DRAFT_569033 [Corynespora cassiicola Philippines]|uniref:EngB-type G domain-containing protein n=1 Tax=Corynespora cassiicola Philippines TaxID=1448308 RepID=A0A2T2P842_CORCC|nr:hypothetical protein BS50DRAFT_569033 [Corynespora cassiicola Philippines]